MVLGKSGQHCSVFGRNGNALTWLSLVGQVLISQVLITQYSLISAAVTVPPLSTESSTDYTTDVTAGTGDMEFLLGNMNQGDWRPDNTDVKMELLKALRAENNDSEPFTDLNGARDEEFQFFDLGCFVGACSFRVIHPTKSFVIKLHVILDSQRAYTQVDPNPIEETLKLEYKALTQRYEALPGLVPKPYVLSLNNSAIVMEDFNEFVPMKDLFVSGQMTDEALDNIPVTLANLHGISFNKPNSPEYNDFMTNKLTEAIVKAKYTQLFSNATVDKLKELGVNFTNMDKLGSPEIVDKVNQLYTNITENKEVTLHGWPTGENVLVSAGIIRLIGNQFAWVGPRALDVSTLLAQLLANYHVQILTEQDNDVHREIAYRMSNASIRLVDTYKTRMSMTDVEEVKKFVSMVAGCTGVDLICWSFAVSITNREAATAAFDSGMRLIEASHRIDSAGFLTNIALMLTQ